MFKVNVLGHAGHKIQFSQDQFNNQNNPFYTCDLELHFKKEKTHEYMP